MFLGCCFCILNKSVEIGVFLAVGFLKQARQPILAVLVLLIVDASGYTVVGNLSLDTQGAPSGNRGVTEVVVVKQLGDFKVLHLAREQD